MTMRSAFCAKRVDGGRVRHAVLRISILDRALCAFVPATRRGGWFVDPEHPELADVTCKGCLAVLARRFPQSVGER